MLIKLFFGTEFGWSAILDFSYRVFPEANTAADSCGQIATVCLVIFWPAALAPTLLLWRLDRRRVPPGHCRECRYNLTGNTTGRCPECGAPFTIAAR